MEKKYNSNKGALSFTVINYLGIAIGIFATLFIFPRDKELIGVFRFIEGITYILYPIFVLGSSQALLNFYPKLSFFLRRRLFIYSFWIVFSISGVFLIGIIIFYLFDFSEKYHAIYFAFPIAFFLANIELFKKKSAIVKKFTVPTFLEVIIPKLSLSIIFILVLTKEISSFQSLILYVISFGVVYLLTLLYFHKYLKSFFNLNFSSLFKKVEKKEYFKFSMFAFFGSLGTIFVNRIDSLIVPLFLSMADNGNFSIAVTLVSALVIPGTTLFALYAPIISTYLKTDNMIELNKKYKEVSIFLFFIGALIYSLIYLGISDLFLLLPTGKSLMTTVPIILILGLNILINMGTGFNTEIITYSKYYRFNLKAIFILVFLKVSLSIFFLYYLKLGIVYVAVASLISMVVFNLIKLIFIYKKFKLFPFNLKYLFLVITFVSVVVFISYIPDTISNFFNLVTKMTLCLTLNLVIVYRLNLVVQYNEVINSFFDKMKIKRV